MGEIHAGSILTRYPHSVPYAPVPREPTTSTKQFHMVWGNSRTLALFPGVD